MTSVKSVSLLFGTILFATVIQLLPLSGYYFLWRPNFLFLVTIGWIIFRPNDWGIGFAAVLGLFADMVFRSPVGLYVLVFGVIASLPLILSRWLVYFTIVHRCIFVFILVIIFELLENAIFGLWGTPTDYRSIPIRALLSGLTWPIFDKFFTKVVILRP